MENKLEKKVYSGWAFKEFEREKAQINSEIYKELKAKYKIGCFASGREKDNLDDFDLVFDVRHDYGKNIYTLIKNKTTLSVDELALIVDGGNLCFGHYCYHDTPVIGMTITIWND